MKRRPREEPPTQGQDEEEEDDEEGVRLQGAACGVNTWTAKPLHPRKPWMQKGEMGHEEVLQIAVKILDKYFEAFSLRDIESL